ncbi:uncharacterized protein LOC130898643 [Diorhabda carinulata]|uniref:uncharacterized protein LOC130898643 n=1 Tax=Diorhabda carinulata TaxID=1163345 RepID=UPI0025A08AFF|nr:uncharacterized protein LOC130898643 [Diorhabda carinulata]
MFKIHLILLFFIFSNDLLKVIGKEKQRLHQKKHFKNRQKIKEKCWSERCYISCPIMDPTMPETPISSDYIMPELNDDTDDFYDEQYRNIKRSKFVLTNRQKHNLLRQVRLGNANGKKAYKFRQNPPSGCYVVCYDYYQIPPYGLPQGNVPSTTVLNNTLVTPPNTVNNEFDDDEDDVDEPYRPGEDQPIEATFSPPEKRSRKLIGKKVQKH